MKSQWVQQETDLALKLFKDIGEPLIIPINILPNLKTLSMGKQGLTDLDNIIRIDISDLEEFSSKIDELIRSIREDRSYIYEGRIFDIYNSILENTQILSRTSNVSIMKQPDNKGNFLINALRQPLKTIYSIFEVIPPKTHCRTTIKVKLTNKKEIPKIKIKPFIYRTSFFKTNRGFVSYVEGYETGLNGRYAVWFNQSDNFMYVNHLALLRSNDGGKTAEVVFDLEEPDFSLFDDEDENICENKPIIKKLHYPVISKDDRYIAISLDQEIPNKSEKENHLRIWDQTENHGLIATEGSGLILASGHISQSKLWAPHSNSLLFGLTLNNSIGLLPRVLTIKKNGNINLYSMEKPIYTAITHFAWSPDGSEIALVRGGGGIYDITIYDKKFKKKRISKTITGSYVRWLNEEEILMISGGAGNYGLATFSVKDLSKKRVISKTGNQYREFEISTNRQLIAYWESDSNNDNLRSLWVQHINSGDRFRIAEVLFDETHSVGGVDANILSWNFDSKKIIVSVNDSIVILEIPF